MSQPVNPWNAAQAAQRLAREAELVATIMAAGTRGMSVDDLMASGTYAVHMLVARLQDCKHKGTLFSVRKWLDGIPRTTYFARSDWAAAFKAPPPKPPKPPKPAKVAKPAPIKPAPVKAAPPKPAPAVADYSRAKVTVCPGGADNRFTFTPPPGWKGAITRDWQERRLQEMTA